MSGLSVERRGFAIVALQNPKNPINIGSVMRAAGNWGVSFVLSAGIRNQYRPVCTDTMAAYRHIPIIACDELHKMIPYDCVPVAVELIEGAQSLASYQHPERAFYVFGPEDGTLGKEITSWCRDVVQIPSNGCMNLAATVNVVLYDRWVKSHRARGES